MVPAAVDLEEGEHFEVSKLITHRTTPRGTEYLVRWSGYDESEDLFVPEDELAEYAPIILGQYKAKLGL